jgi:hypothetical protein
MDTDEIAALVAPETDEGGKERTERQTNLSKAVETL